MTEQEAFEKAQALWGSDATVRYTACAEYPECVVGVFQPDPRTGDLEPHWLGYGFTWAQTFAAAGVFDA